MADPAKPPTEYGPWTRGNAGTVGRTVTKWYPSILIPGEWHPVVDWEPHPDEITTQGGTDAPPHDQARRR